MPNFSGIWTVTQQMQAKGASTWPSPPGAPTIGTATGGNAQASVTFSAPSCTGYPAGVTGYRVISTPGCISNTGASSPIVVTGLTNGTSYTFKAQATNATGYGELSAASNSVTPVVPTCTTYTTPGCYTFVVPSGVTSISVVVVGNGGNGSKFNYQYVGCPFNDVIALPGAGGGGGGVRYQNNISVTPGSSYSVSVKAGGSGGSTNYTYFCSSSTIYATGGGNATIAAGGSYPCGQARGGTAGSYNGGACGGYGQAGASGGFPCGGTRGAGGGGAGGYNSSGVSLSGGGRSGSTNATNTYGGTGGGGFGLVTQAIAAAPAGSGGSGGTNGVVATGIAGGNGGAYGGGGGGSGGVSTPCSGTGGTGGNGAVRIVWCKCGVRGTPSFPSTNVGP